MLERLTALSEGCAAVLLAGDLFDSARVYRDTLEALRAALAACRCPVFIAPGNHDALLPGSPYLENGWPENVHIFRTAEPERVSLPEGCVNCLTEAVWNALDRENRVSLWTRTVDLRSGEVRTRIVNANE